MIHARPRTRILIFLALVAGGVSQAECARPGAAAPPAQVRPLDEETYRYALAGIANYHSCGVDAAVYAGLGAQLRSIEAAARAKGLGPTLDRVRRDYMNLLAVSTMAACGGGRAGALAGARQGVASFQAWVAGATAVTLTPAQQEAEIVRAIVALEEAQAAAEIARDDAALAHVLDAHFVPLNADGSRADKVALLRAMGRTTLYRQTVVERHVEISGDSATVTGIVNRLFLDPPDPAGTRFRFTETYQSRDGIWRLVTRNLSDQPLP